MTPTRKQIETATPAERAALGFEPCKCFPNAVGICFICNTPQHDGPTSAQQLAEMFDGLAKLHMENSLLHRFDVDRRHGNMMLSSYAASLGRMIRHYEAMLNTVEGGSDDAEAATR